MEKHLFIVFVPCFGRVIITYSGYPGYSFVISRINFYNSAEFSFYDRPCGLHSYCQYLIQNVPVDFDLYFKKSTNEGQKMEDFRKSGRLSAKSDDHLNQNWGWWVLFYSKVPSLFYNLGHSIFNSKTVQILWPFKSMLIDRHLCQWPRPWPSTLNMVSNFHDMSSFLPTEIFKNFRISLHAKI